MNSLNEKLRMYKLRNNHYLEHVDNQIIVQSCMRFTPRIMCWWGRSSRRCDHQLDPRAEPRLLEAPCTLPCALQCAFLLPFLLPEAAPRTQTGNKTVVLSLSEWVGTWLPPVKAYATNFEIFGEWVQRSIHFAATQDKPVRKSPCIWNLPPANLDWSASFFSLLLPFVNGGAGFQLSHTWEVPSQGHNPTYTTVKFGQSKMMHIGRK